MKNLISFNRASVEHELIHGTGRFCINPDDSAIFFINGSGQLIKLLPVDTVSKSSQHVNIQMKENV